MVKEDSLCDVSNIKDLVERTIQKYKNHPSTKIIKEAFEKKKKKFSFYFVSSYTIYKESFVSVFRCNFLFVFHE